MPIVSDETGGSSGRFGRVLSGVRDTLYEMEEERKRREEEERRKREEEERRRREEIARKAQEMARAARDAAIGRAERTGKEAPKVRTAAEALERGGGGGLGSQVSRLGGLGKDIGRRAEEVRGDFGPGDVARVTGLAARAMANPGMVPQALREKGTKESLVQGFAAANRNWVREEDMPENWPDWLKRGLANSTSSGALALTALTAGVGGPLGGATKNVGRDVVGNIGYELTAEGLDERGLPWYVREPLKVGGAVGAVLSLDAPAGVRGAKVLAKTPTGRNLVKAISREDGQVDFDAVAKIAKGLNEKRAGVFSDVATREGRQTGGVFDEVLPTEKVERGVMARFEGGTGKANLQVGKELEEGNSRLVSLGIGSKDGRRVLVKKTPEIEQLYKALHGEATVPPRLQGVYDDIKRTLEVETGESLGLGDRFVPIDDYFYRGWKVGKQGNPAGAWGAGSTPGFRKQRVEKTFSEMLEEGREPLSWNPYEMLALRRQAGMAYRNGLDLVDRLKQSSIAVEVKPGTRAPIGYKIPDAGPAFTGKQFAYLPDSEEAIGAQIGRTSQWAVPEKFAKQIEAMYGKEPDLGMFNAFVSLGEKTKRAKLLVSFFQQVDFTTRNVGSGFGGAMDALAAGKPLTAAQRLVDVPMSVGRLAWANVSKTRRAALRDEFLSSADLFPERKGISMAGILDAGMGTNDPQIMRDVVKATLDDVVKEAGSTSLAGKPLRVVKGLQQSFEDGLFQGVYREAQLSAIKNHIGPRIIRQHPDWSNSQIMRAIADQVNERFSTMGAYQSVFQNPATRKFLRGLVFSTNEPEGLLRQSFAPFVGGNKMLAAEYWAGTALGIFATANLVHYLSTGEWLPAERYVPVKIDPNSPVGISYSSEFGAPDLPLKGRGGTRLTLDLVGQMDTALRVLDPKHFVQSRYSVPVRAAWTQATGEDYFGRPVTKPLDRLIYGFSEMLEPIGMANVRSAFDIGPDSEARLGMTGSLFQGTGVNLRAETNVQLKNRLAEGAFGVTWDRLEPSQRNQLLSDNPEFKAELERRLDEAVATGSDWAKASKAKQEFVDGFVAEQRDSDAALDAGDITPEQWRTDQKVRLAVLRGRIDGLAAVTPPMVPGEESPLTRLAAVMNEASGPGGTITDHEKVDAFFATLSEEEAAYISRNTGLYYTPKQQEQRVDTKVIVDSGYWDLETGRTQFLRDHPEVRSLVEKWGYSESIITYLRAEDKARSHQEASDRRLREGGFRDVAQWREDYYARRDGLRAVQEALWADMPQERTDEGPLGAWFAYMDEVKASDPEGKMDWDAVDRWVAALPESEQAVINSYEGKSLTAAVADYKQAAKRISNAGYWDIGDSRAQQYAKRLGFTEVRTMEDLRNAVWQKQVDLYTARGMGLWEAQLRADTYADKRLRRLESLITRERQIWRRRNQELATLLARWGFWDPGEKDTRRILSA